jgi:hypothetical protein
MSTHTPTPWVCEQMGRTPEPPEVATVCHVGEWVVGVHTPGYPGGDYRYIDCGDPAGKDDAEFIVRCVNAFPELVKALEAAEQCIGELSPTQARVEAMQMIQAALSAVRGEA